MDTGLAPRPRLVLAACAALAGLAFPAAGMPVSYQCTGYRMLSAEFTPRTARLHFDGQDYALRRVPDAREATFVDGRSGVTVVTRQRELSLHLPNESLSCQLRSQALADLSPASRPVPGPGASAASR